MDYKSTMQSTVPWQCGDSATAGCAVSYSYTLVAECRREAGNTTYQNASPNLFRYRFSTKYESGDTPESLAPKVKLGVDDIAGWAIFPWNW